MKRILVVTVIATVCANTWLIYDLSRANAAALYAHQRIDSLLAQLNQACERLEGVCD